MGSGFMLVYHYIVKGHFCMGTWFYAGLTLQSEETILHRPGFMLV